MLNIKAIYMTIHKKTFVPPQEKEIFQQMNIIKIIFFLDDDLLLQKGSQFYYTKDNNILFDKNIATNLLTGKAYNVLDFVVQFLTGGDNKTSFRLATLLLHYYHTHPEKQNNWDFAFYQKYGINPPACETPRQEDLNTLKAQHNHSNNKYLMAHFMQLYKTDQYVLRDMIFRGFLVADSQKNACFLIYGNLENRDHVIGIPIKRQRNIGIIITRMWSPKILVPFCILSKGMRNSEPLPIVTYSVPRLKCYSTSQC